MKGFKDLFMKLMSSGLGCGRLPVTGIHRRTRAGVNHVKPCSAPAPYLKLSLLGGSNPTHTETLKTASAFLIFDLKEAADVMKDKEKQAYIFNKNEDVLRALI